MLRTPSLSPVPRHHTAHGSQQGVRDREFRDRERQRQRLRQGQRQMKRLRKRKRKRKRKMKRKRKRKGKRQMKIRRYPTASGCRAPSRARVSLRASQGRVV
jgi:type VI secretion system secreted protein VgrG